MAVFSIDPALLDRIKTNGLRSLGTSPKPRRAAEHPFSYAKWQQTPADIALGGLRCAPIERALENSITTALSASGSYYTTSRKSELVVIPSLGLVVLSIFDY
jgi:hypothetical protein